MITTYKYKLYSSKNLKYLNNKIDISGIIWNHCIALHKRHYKLYNKYLNVYKLQKHITKLKKLKKYEFWKLVNAGSIQNITERIDKSYKQFFRKIKKKQKTRPPKFQKIKKYKSITFKRDGYKILDNNKIRIQNKIFKYSKSRDITDKENIKTLSIKRTDSGFYIFFTFDKKIESNNFKSTNNFKLGKITGIDVGLKTFLTLSDKEPKEFVNLSNSCSNKEKSPEFFKNNLKLIKKLSKKLSKKQKGSKNREKARIRLSKAYERTTNKRKDYFFKLSNDLTKEYSYIFIEDLDIRVWKKLWGRKVSDIAVGEFFRILEYQGSKNSCVVHKINKWFPSSKTCSDCGCINMDLELKDRTWICPDCGAEHNRDLNAAINIEREGASSLRLDNVRLSDSGSSYCLNLESQLL